MTRLSRRSRPWLLAGLLAAAGPWGSGGCDDGGSQLNDGAASADARGGSSGTDARADGPRVDAGGGQTVDAAGAEAGDAPVITVDAAVDRTAPDVAVDGPPVIGLARRPTNTTCVAQPKPTGGVDDPFPKSIKQSGCFDAADPRKPASGLIPYALNATLWSDGAEKERWMALPEGAQVHINAAGDFEFPIGTVLVKLFRLGGKRIETRLFMRHSDGAWAGYSYEWNADETDATLVDAVGKNKFIGEVDWLYPSRESCLRCHTAVAGFSLGPETAQLNRDFDYPGGVRANEIETLRQIGIFDNPPTLPAAQLPALADPFGGAPVADRARAYLHANCSGCHRPDGVKDLPMDLRYQVGFAATNTCGVAPLKGDLGNPNYKVIDPGHADNSMLSVRTLLVNRNRMPPLASSVVDPAGSKLISDWINGLTKCP